MSIKPSCVKCELIDNSNGLFTCNGCRQNFCSNHIIDHSNELRNRFEQIINEYNIINEIFNEYKQKSNDFHWKIIHQQEKNLNEIKLQINESEKTSNYWEQDLDQWMTQLNKIRVQLMKTNESPSSIKRIYSFLIKKLDQLLISNGFRIYFSSILLLLIVYYVNSTLRLNSNIQFSDVNGPIKLSEAKHVAEHNGTDSVPGSFRIEKIYSEGVHHVRLSFEKFSSPNTFIGIIGSTSDQSISSSHGWFIGNKHLIDHKPGEYRIFQIIREIRSFFENNQLRNALQERDIKQGDLIEIEIDCINTKITLTNKQTNRKYQLNIDLEQSPLPWQIIINFDRLGDRARLH